MRRLLLLLLSCTALRSTVTAKGHEAWWSARVLDREPNAHLQRLSEFTDGNNSLARTFMSPAHKQAAQQIKTWMEDAGMESWIDIIGNVHGLIQGSYPDAPAIMLGSHYDTALDAGKYDGTLGIITGIAAIKATMMQAAHAAGVDISEPKDKNTDLRISSNAVKSQFVRPVHIVAFTDEEGIRFQSTFLGSRALAGKVLQHRMLQATDKEGLSLEDVLQQEGGLKQGSVAEAVAGLSIPASSIKEYVEVHIEQGPILEQLGKPLGVVSAIAGQTRLWFTVHGTQGHAGTVPMQSRKDSLVAGAAMALAVEQICKDTQADDTEQLVCTVGELHVWPGASNVIAGSVQLSVDIRARSDKLREQKVGQVMEAAEAICQQRGMQCELKRTHDAVARNCDSAMMDGLRKAISTVVGDQDDIPTLVSGAGHDALAMAEVTKMAMMFVRCREGISHSPLEYVLPEDVALATAALHQYLAQQLLIQPEVMPDHSEL